MGLTAPIPGLRRIRYDSKSVAKVQINVRPDEVLVVSDDIAGQLQAADSHFKDADAVPPAAPAAEDDDEVPAEADETPVAPARKGKRQG